MTQRSLSKKDYGKAYYKRKVREKTVLNYEILNPSINQFLLNESPTWYVSMFGTDIEDLYSTQTKEHLKDMVVGVVRFSGHIKAIFLLDGSGRIAGDLSKVPLTVGIKESLEYYNVKVGDKGVIEDV